MSYLVDAVCVDDFGSNVYVCRYTKRLVWAEVARVVGAMLPGVKAHYVVEDTIEGRAEHKQSGIWFHESEANCNTCANLERVTRPKNAGFLYGRCKSGKSCNATDSPYTDRTRGEVICFHPDDPMHMPCYESRWAVTA